MVWKGVMDMNECFSFVCKNKLSFRVDLVTDSKFVVGGQCTAGWQPEYKEENCGRPIMYGPGRKECESFHKLGECVNYGGVCVCMCDFTCTDYICYFTEFIIIVKFYSVFV